MAHREEGSFLRRAAERFSVPPELKPGLPVLEVTGAEEVRMSGHRGILSYEEEEISVSGGQLLVRIRGKRLRLRGMSGSELYISGRIESITLE